MEQTVPEKKYCYKITLVKTYGLTPSMVEQLGAPDLVVRNPHYRSGPPASLYLLERVERWIEAHQTEVDQARQARALRSKRMSDVAQRRREQLLAWAGSVGIVVESFPDNLYKRACDHYGDSSVGDGGLIAFARHNYTNYKHLLRLIDGQPGCADAYPVIKSRVNAAVSENLVMHGLLEGFRHATYIR